MFSAVPGSTVYFGGEEVLVSVLRRRIRSPSCSHTLAILSVKGNEIRGENRFPNFFFNLILL